MGDSMAEQRALAMDDMTESNLRFMFDEDLRTGACIKVVGVGGGGSNAVNRMIATDLQGVGYRASCCQKAKDLDLHGWVRNLSDGSVEVQAEGPAHQLTELLLWCERGPAGAEVLSVSTAHLPPSREDWFEIRA